MNVFDEPRRSFLFTVEALGAGEQLVHFRDRGRILIKAGSATGSDSLALGTQPVMRGTGIPIHRHFQMDEAFFVLEGNGAVILNDPAPSL